MTKKGFTLAEVLVTLGIIGVVAALTMPTMGRSATRAKIGPELSTAISTLENATQQFMNDYNANYLSVALKKAECQGRLSDFLNLLVEKGYIKGEAVDVPTTTEPYSASSTGTSTESLKTGGKGILLANRSALAAADSCAFVQVGTEGEGGVTPPSEQCEIIFLTSGFQKRKDVLITGIDAFRVYLTNDGLVSTGGSSDCGEGKSGVDCAGKIADDGWKVTY